MPACSRIYNFGQGMLAMHTINQIGSMKFLSELNGFTVANLEAGMTQKTWVVFLQNQISVKNAPGKYRDVRNGGSNWRRKYGVD